MKRWEIVSLSAGAVLFLGSSLLFGVSAVNFVGVALILLPTVLYVIRYVEDRMESGGRTQ